MNTNKPIEKRSKISPLLKLLGQIFVSGALFIALGLIKLNIQDILMFLLVILFHEFGHYLAMRKFRYQDLKIFFIPLIGGATSGKPETQNATQEAIVSLSGPAFGIITAIISIILFAVTDIGLFWQYSLLAIYINLFQLIPIAPFDGGQFFNSILMERNTTFELIFKACSVILIPIIFFSFLKELIVNSPFVIVFLFFFLIPRIAGFKNRFAVKQITNEIRKSGVLNIYEEFNESARYLIYRELVDNKIENIDNKLVKSVYDRAKKIYPSGIKTFGFVILWFFMILLPIAISLYIPRNMIGKAYMYMSGENYEEAIEYFEKIENMDIRTAQVYSAKAFCELELGNYEQSIHNLDMALERIEKNTKIISDEDIAFIYFLRSVAKKKIGDNKGYLEDYNTATALDPELRGREYETKKSKQKNKLYNQDGEEIKVNRELKIEF